MKTKHIMTLLQEGFTTVTVQFMDGRGVPVKKPAATSSAPWNPNQPPPMPQPPMPQASTQRYDNSRLYTYKTLLKDNVQPNDTVVVIVGNEMVLVKVVEVHELPQIDLDADFDYKWIVQRIDTAAYDKMQEKEQQFQQAMVEVERVKQREKVKQEMTQLLIDSPVAKGIFEGAVKSLNQLVDIDFNKGEADADK